MDCLLKSFTNKVIYLLALLFFYLFYILLRCKVRLKKVMQFELGLYRWKIRIRSSVTRKKSPNVYKSCPKMISIENESFWHLYKNCPGMWEIWANELLKSCPKSNKSPNLVRLIRSINVGPTITVTTTYMKENKKN